MVDISEADYAAGRADRARGATTLLARIVAAAADPDLEAAAVSYALGLADAIREERRQRRSERL
jgi:hypothetical protein